MMNTKALISVIIFAAAGLFFYSFVWSFKEIAVDNVSLELSNLQTAVESAKNQRTLDALKLKKHQLSENELSLLKNFIPDSLHSGSFVYNISQLANQNRLTIKNLQYTVLRDPLNKDVEQKLQMEFTMDGRYEDFSNWLKTIEKSNVLIDAPSIRGTKASNNSDNISFTVKLIAYGRTID